MYLYANSILHVNESTLKSFRECCLHNVPASRSFIREHSHESRNHIQRSDNRSVRIYTIPFPSFQPRFLPLFPLLVLLFGLEDVDLFVFSTLSRPTAESAARVVNLSLWFNYTGKYYRTDGVN